MPIDDLKNSQKQMNIFYRPLSEELNPKHKLYQLKEVINWDRLEQGTLKLMEVKKRGRMRKDIRLLLGLSMLQAMCNTSDNLTSETLEENMYWQYFCGYEYPQKGLIISESVIRRFRQLLDVTGHELILQELATVGLSVGAYKKKDLDSVIIDTTVQIKNIKHPHDAHLLEKARKEIVNLCQRHEIRLNETYELAFKRNTIQLWKYKDQSNAIKRKKLMKRMKTLMGRLVRIFAREAKARNLLLSAEEQIILAKIHRIYNQSFLGKQQKEAYKAEGNEVLYSFHAPEVECIGKGKLYKPYEFGNKVGIAVTGRNNFILGVASFHGNPYDGHTLTETVLKVENTIAQEVGNIFVDLGYRGSNYKYKSQIYTPYTKKEITSKIKSMQRRRSAIEPIIGHLKQYGRMGKNYLKGVIGDIINPIISAIGFNLRSITNSLLRQQLKLQPI